MGAGSLGAGGRAYLVLALASQFALLHALAVAPALLGWLARPLRPLALVAVPLAQALVQVCLQADRTLLAILGLHLDRAVLRVVLAPGGLAALDMQQGEVVRIAIGLVVLVGLEALGWALALRWSARPARLRAERAILAAALLLFSGERVAYAAAAAVGWRESAHAAAALPSFVLEEALHTRLASNERLRYPRAPLRWTPVAQPPSILWIVIESWRADALDPDLTPALWRFAETGTRYLDHRSGGNWTQSGVFSMFYGLHASYVTAAEGMRRQPVLIDRLRDLGHDLHVIASRSTKFPHFEFSVFAGLPPSAIEDRLEGPDSAATDRILVERAKAYLAGRDPAKPFFLALFFDATHLPFAFAPDSVRHRPYTERLYYTEMTEPQPREPIWNRYLNAVADVDRTVGAVLDALGRSGLADRTIVVLTGDHGEEFYERGALGHNISFDREQTAVPLVIRIPGEAPGVHPGLSRHVDIVPTLLARLGAASPPEDYGQGTPLVPGGAADRAVMCGWRACAVLDARGFTAVFRPGDPAPARVFDPEWRPAPAGRAAAVLPEVRRELSAFLE